MRLIENIKTRAALAIGAAMRNTLNELFPVGRASLNIKHQRVRRKGSLFVLEDVTLTETLAARYEVALDFPIGVGWYASVDGYSLILSTINTLASGEAPLRTSGAHGAAPGRSIRVLKSAENPLAAGGETMRDAASVVQPLRKLKDGK